MRKNYPCDCYFPGFCPTLRFQNLVYEKTFFRARAHKPSARLIIIISFLLLTVLGIVTGTLLQDTGISISSAALFVFISIYLAAVITYPSKHLKGNKLSSAAFYVRQKFCDLLLAASTFCMIVYFSNQPGQLFNYSSSLNAAVPVSSSFPKDSTIRMYKTIAAFSASLQDESGRPLKWKEKKKLLKEQIRAIKNTGGMSKSDKTGLIVLSVLAAVGLLFVVLSLACNLSCNGSEGAAILVGIGGTALIILLLVIVLRSIRRGKKQPKDTDIKPDGAAQPGKK